MESQHVRVLRQPQRRLLLQNAFAVAVHHAGAINVFPAAGGKQRAQLLFCLLLRQAVQIEKQFRGVVAPPQFFSS